MHNLKDGAMIHCCRKYLPDQVYLYLSKEMIDLEEKDRRYTGCLKKLYKDLGAELHCNKILRPNLVDVHDFNYFYSDFIKVLNGIMKRMSSDDILYLNVSSGTPSMKGALVGWATLTDADVVLLQVDTPEKSMNKHSGENFSYDSIDELWEHDLDNGKIASRCHEIACPSIVLLKYKEMVKQLIRSYDYEGALRIISMEKRLRGHEYEQLVRFTQYRLVLDKANMAKIESAYSKKEFPIRLPCPDSEDRDIIEYALSLKVKSMRKEYADFFRGLTPLMTRLLILVLQENSLVGKTIVNDYMVRDSNGGYRWRTKVDPLIWESFWGNDKSMIPKNRKVYSHQICALIMRHCSGDEYQNLREDCATLRIIEERVRNVAAHEIRGITQQYISEQFSGNKTINPEYILKLIEKIFSYTDICLPKKAWQSYNQMNRVIINLIQ